MDQKCACKGFFLDKLIQPAILVMLKEAPSHGFQLISCLEESRMVAGNTLDPAGLYRTLKKMEESGLLTSHWQAAPPGKPKRIFTITEEGSHCLANWHETLTAYQENIQLMLAQIEAST